MTKDEVKKLRMNSPESLQFLNNATKFYNLMMMYRCAIREIQTKLEVLDDEFSVENNRNPISFIKTRIKKPNSIYNKLQKMGHDSTRINRTAAAYPQTGAVQCTKQLRREYRHISMM